MSKEANPSVSLCLTEHEALVLEATFLESLNGPPIGPDLDDVLWNIAHKLAATTAGIDVACVWGGAA